MLPRSRSHGMDRHSGMTLPVPDPAVCRQESELGFESPRGRRIKETRGEPGRGRPYPRKGRPGNGQRSGAMSLILVVDQERRPLAPVHPGTARWLLSHGKAAVLHRAPFTLILKRVGVEARPEPLRLKLDPGSTTTGLAVRSEEHTSELQSRPHLV